MAVRYVEYIQSSGTQYIDTGFKPNNNTRVVIDAVLIIASSTKRLYGVRSGSMSNAFAFDASSSGYYLVEYAAEQKNFSTSIKYTDRFTIDHNKNVVTLNGQHNVTCANSTFNATYNLILFGINNAGTITGSEARIYSCKIYDNGTLARDYVPCLDNNDVACLYDKVNKECVYNAGTGTFTAGAVIAIPAVDFGTVCRMPLRIGKTEKIDYADNFADNDWATIAAVCSKGLVPASWKVGDQKAMTINGTSYPIDIIGIQHDDYADGSGKAPFTFGLHDCYATKYAMAFQATNAGGYDSSVMHMSYLPEIFGLMPTEVQSSIKQVNKLSSEGNASSAIETVACDLFLLSEIEVFGSVTYSKSGEGNQYAYYKNGGSKSKTVSGASSIWWLRSPYGSSSNRYCGVTGSGAPDYNGSNNSLGVAFAFCFGNKVGGSGGGGETPTKEYAVTIKEVLSGLLSQGVFTLTANGKNLSVGTVAMAEGTKIAITGQGGQSIFLNGTEVATSSPTEPYYYTVSSNTTINVGRIDMSITTE